MSTEADTNARGNFRDTTEPADSNHSYLLIAETPAPARSPTVAQFNSAPGPVQHSPQRTQASTAAATGSGVQPARRSLIMNPTSAATTTPPPSRGGAAGASARDMLELNCTARAKLLPTLLPENPNLAADMKRLETLDTLITFLSRRVTIEQQTTHLHQHATTDSALTTPIPTTNVDTTNLAATSPAATSTTSIRTTALVQPGDQFTPKPIAITAASTPPSTPPCPSPPPAAPTQPSAKHGSLNNAATFSKLETKWIPATIDEEPRDTAIRFETHADTLRAELNILAVSAASHGTALLYTMKTDATVRFLVNDADDSLYHQPYDDLRTTILRLFDPSFHDDDTRRVRLLSMQQNVNETLLSYAARYAQAAGDRLFTDLEMSKTQFLLNANDDKIEVIWKNATRVAQGKYDNIPWKEFITELVAHVQNYTALNGSSEWTSQSTRTQRRSVANKKKEPNSGTTNSSRRDCTWCKIHHPRTSTRHREEVCFKKKQALETAPATPPTSLTAPSAASLLANTTHQCFHCAKIGHVVADCPAKAAGTPRTDEAADVLARHRRRHLDNSTSQATGTTPTASLLMRPTPLSRQFFNTNRYDVGYDDEYKHGDIDDHPTVTSLLQMVQPTMTSHRHHAEYAQACDEFAESLKPSSASKTNFNSFFDEAPPVAPDNDGVDTTPATLRTHQLTAVSLPATAGPNPPTRSRVPPKAQEAGILPYPTQLCGPYIDGVDTHGRDSPQHLHTLLYFGPVSKHTGTAGAKLPALAIVDTGAPLSTIHPNMIERYGIETKKLDTPIAFSGFGGTGTTTATQCASLTIRHGTHAVDAVDVIVMPNPLRAPFIVGTDLTSSIGISLGGLQALSPAARDTRRRPPPLFNEDDTPEYIDAERLAECHAIVRDAKEANLALSSSKFNTEYSKFYLRAETENLIPHNKKQYRLAQTAQLALDKRMAKMLLLGYIKPAEDDNPFNNVHVCTPKKNGETGLMDKFRCCLDPRDINKHTPPWPNNLTIPDHLLEDLQECSIFSAFDVADAFMTMEFGDEADMAMTAFTWQGRKYVYTRLVYGLRNAATHCQSTISRCATEGHAKVLSTHPNSRPPRTYVDDLIKADMDDDYIAHAHGVRAIIEAFTAAGVKLNWERLKTRLFWKRGPHLGHYIQHKGRAAEVAKCSAVADWPTPTTGADLHSFIGFTQFLARYCPKYQDLCVPLTPLCAVTSIKALWTDECQAAFDSIRLAICERVMLNSYIPGLPLHLATDASLYAAGAYLYQVLPDTDEHHVLGFFSKKFNAPQVEMDANARELLAIILSLRHFNFYIAGRHVDLHTDHRALTYLHTQERPSRHQVNWFDEIYAHDFTPHHIKGILNVLPDRLSRRVRDGVGHEPTFVPVSSPLYRYARKRRDAKATIATTCLLSTKAGTKFTDPAITSLIANAIDITNVSVAELPANPSKQMQQFIRERLDKREPPPSERAALITAEHSIGHFGAMAMFNQLFMTSNVYWSTMLADCKRAVQHCRPCLQHNVTQSGFNPLRSGHITLPGQEWASDDAGPLPITDDGYAYISINVCRATRFVQLYAKKSTTADEQASVYMKLVASFGPPQGLTTDNGVCYRNRVMDALCRRVTNTQQRFALPQNPRGNGLAEAFVKQVKKIIAKLLECQTRFWKPILSTVQFALNRKINGTTGSSPFSLMFGRACGDLLVPTPTIDTPDDVDPVKFAEAINALHKAMREIVYPAIDTRKSSHDDKLATRINNKRKTHDEPFKLNSAVMIVNKNRTRMLQPRYLGPFTIIYIDPKNKSYLLRDATGSVHKCKVPIDQLKLVHGPEGEHGDFNSHHVDDDFQVRAIVAHCGPINARFYKLLWKGYPDTMSTWEPAANVNSPKHIEDYWRSDISRNPPPTDALSESEQSTRMRALHSSTTPTDNSVLADVSTPNISGPGLDVLNAPPTSDVKSDIQHDLLVEALGHADPALTPATLADFTSPIQLWKAFSGPGKPLTHAIWNRTAERALTAANTTDAPRSRRHARR